MAVGGEVLVLQPANPAGVSDLPSVMAKSLVAEFKSVLDKKVNVSWEKSKIILYGICIGTFVYHLLQFSKSKNIAELQFGTTPSINFGGTFTAHDRLFLVAHQYSW